MLNKNNMLPDVDKKYEKSSIVKLAGYMEKKGRMRVVGVRRWKKRWCVLEGKLLLYFKTKQEYSHQLSPCRGSVNMGLVLSITPRGPCQLQIVTRSQIIIFRTKTKFEQDEWFAALWDARNNNLTCVGRPRRDRKSSVLVEMHYRLTNCASADSSGSCIISENHLRYGRTLKDSFDDIYFEVGKKNGIHVAPDRKKSSRALRKSESDNRISFYRELHGLARTDPASARRPPIVSGKESVRSRSLSYESIYFKPQEKCKQPVEPAKSRSCRELVPTVVKRAPKVNRGDDCFRTSKKMSRSVSFLRRRCDDNSDTDDYDYAEVSSNRHKCATSIIDLPSRLINVKDEETVSTSSVPARSDDFPCDSREANIDVIYVDNNRNIKLFENESDSGLLLEYGTERSVEIEDEPPPLPIKKKHKRDPEIGEKRQYRITNGVYVIENGTEEEVIYDVPIRHGELIQHFRKLSMVTPLSNANNAVYDDSLEPSLFDPTLQMTPDSLEIATMFPTYKRWSNDSGFNNYEELSNNHSPLSVDHQHQQSIFEDSLEPVIAIIQRDRKIWQNVPNINSTDYFR